MASRTQPATKKTAANRKRNTAPLKKQTPWGLIAGGVAIVVFAVAVIGYAATRPKFDPNNPDIKGLVSEEYKGADHRTGAVSYDVTPPMGGAHNSAALQCAVYEQPVQNETAVHSLEHGAVWITYRPDLPKAEISKLSDMVDGNQYRMLSPYPDLPAPIVASAWGKQLKVDNASDKRLKQFLRAFTSGPQAPERGAACSGVSTAIPLGGAAAVPTPDHS